MIVFRVEKDVVSQRVSSRGISEFGFFLASSLRFRSIC
jgi:hypothetical protein